MNCSQTLEVGPELRDARLARGLSQQALANGAGCSMSMIALLESGYRPKQSRVLDRIADVLQNDERPSLHSSTSREISTADHGSGLDGSYK